MHLTKGDIDKAKYSGKSPKERCVLWDDDPRGLGLRILPSGKKVFVLSYRNAARQSRMMTLADYGVYTLAQARKEAKIKLAALVSTQVDPLTAKEERRREALTDTIEKLHRAWIVARDVSRPKEHLRMGELHIYPRFGNRPWKTLRRSEVRKWHEDKKNEGSLYVANRALQDLRAAIYRQLWQQDELTGNDEARPLNPKNHRDSRNPCAGIKLYPEQRRQVRLESDEWPRIDTAIDEETDDEYMRAFFRVSIALGSRKGELKRLLWSDVKFGSHSSVTLRDVKSDEHGQSHVIPLSEYAQEQLKSLTPIDGNPYVFVGHVHGKHLVNVNDCWDRIRKRAGVPHIHIHDLRRSFGSWLADAGFTSKQIGAVLAHRSDITSRVYMALGQSAKRTAVNAMQKLIANAGKRKKQKRVVRLTKGAAR
jgi:integrase